MNFINNRDLTKEKVCVIIDIEIPTATTNIKNSKR